MRFCPRCGSRYEHERFCPEDGAPTAPLPEAGPPKDVLLGTLVDARYRVDAQIGEGGMGAVYRATHVALNKPVALKILRGDMAKDPEVVQRFMQEAQAATSIGHENIIDIHDFGRLKDGTAYFVMELLGGRPLSELIKLGGSIPTADAVQILKQIASALGAAHERGIVHRDLKPDNVFAMSRGELTNFVKVLDFGIAKVGTTKNKLTRTGMVFGTPHYMSPEQAAGQGVDARTDIYALGVIMYEMFTGRVPFEADTFMGVLTKHMFEKPAPMFAEGAERQLGALEQITLRALEKKPENRYQSMREMVDDLDRVLGGAPPRPVSEHRPSLELADALEPRSKSELRIAEQLAATTPAPPMSATTSPSSIPQLPVRRTWPLAAGAGALALVVLAIVLTLRGGREDAVAHAPPLPPPPPQVTRDAAATAPAAQAEPSPSPKKLPEGVVLREVMLTSEPAGAEIFVDGVSVGKAPASVPRPARGAHAVELRLDGYVPRTVQVGADGPSTLAVALTRRAPAAAKARPPVRKPPANTPRRGRSEVVDPWAD